MSGNNTFRIGDCLVEQDLDRISRGTGAVTVRPQVMEVLVYLASKPGQVIHSDELLENVWPGKMVTSASVYNCITELRHAFQTCDDSRPYVDTVPRRGYRLVAPVHDPEEPEYEAIQDSASPFYRRPVLMVTSLLAAVIIVFACITWWPSAPVDKSIAVMAFENMSGDPEQEYFSDGISEELLNVLAQVPELRVISRSSAFSFKDKDISTPAAAKQLKVTYVLEGSVRKMGNRVRITAQLIEARADTHVWSNTFDRELEDIFAIQEEISVAVAGALAEHLGFELEIPRLIRTENIDAHDAYLRGRHLVSRRTSDSIEAAVREFEKAVALDPAYALAHAELALAIDLLKNIYHGELTAIAAESRAIPHAERAMALDPNLAQAHMAMGIFQQTREETLAYFERAVRINPNYSEAHSEMTIILNSLGRYAEAFSASEKALRLDPLSIPAIRFYVESLIARNRLEEAGRELKKIASIYPALYTELNGILNSVGGQRTNFILGYLDVLLTEPESVWYRNRLSFRFAVIDLESEALAIPQEIWPFILNDLGRPLDALAKTEALRAEDPAQDFYRDSMGYALAAAGEYARARPLLEELWQRNDWRVTRSYVFSVWEAMALIAIRRQNGDEAGVSELLEAIREDVSNYRKAGITRATDLIESVDFEEGVYAYLTGEREKGLALMAKGAEDGFFIPPNEAYYQVLFDDPGFDSILADQVARQKRERDKFLAIVCPDNPYEAVWQPAEGTCERFALESEN